MTEFRWDAEAFALTGGTHDDPTIQAYCLVPPDTEAPEPEAPPPSPTQEELDRQYSLCPISFASISSHFRSFHLLCLPPLIFASLLSPLPPLPLRCLHLIFHRLLAVFTVSFHPHYIPAISFAHPPAPLLIFPLL